VGGGGVEQAAADKDLGSHTLIHHISLGTASSTYNEDVAAQWFRVVMAQWFQDVVAQWFKDVVVRWFHDDMARWF
jgi:hypothetical protein